VFQFQPAPRVSLVSGRGVSGAVQIDANVYREIANHRSLRHPNIVQFRGLALTDTHLAILMEYVAGALPG
jgi:serine/threonine-protein kinase SRK2